MKKLIMILFFLISLFVIKDINGVEIYADVSVYVDTYDDRGKKLQRYDLSTQTIDGITWNKNTSTLTLDNICGNYDLFINGDKDERKDVSLIVSGDSRIKGTSATFNLYNINLLFAGEGKLKLNPYSAKTNGFKLYDSSINISTCWIELDGFVSNVDSYGNCRFGIDSGVFAVNMESEVEENYCGEEFVFIKSVLEVEGDINVLGGMIIIKYPEIDGCEAFVFNTFISHSNINILDSDVYVLCDESIRNEFMVFDAVEDYGIINGTGSTSYDDSDLSIDEYIDSLIGDKENNDEKNSKDKELSKAVDKETYSKDISEKDNYKTLKKGDVIIKGKLRYKIVKAGSVDKSGSLKVLGCINKRVKSIKIPNAIKYNGIKYYITAIGNKAFKNSKYLKKLVVCGNVKVIGMGACAGCKNLRYVAIPSGKLTTICNMAFVNDKKLSKVIIKSRRLRKIGKKAFKGVSNKCKFIIKSKRLRKMILECKWLINM